MGRIDHSVGFEVGSTLPAESVVAIGGAVNEMTAGPRLHHDLGDGFGGNWESAWIDLGGEG